MARERLAAMRKAQQQSGRSEATTSQSGDETIERRRSDQYEMSQTRARETHGGSDAMSEFYSEVGSIQNDLRTLNDHITRISDLHLHSLTRLDEATTQRNAKKLDDLVGETSTLTNQLKGRIKKLQERVGTGREGLIRKQQTGLVKQKFVEAIQNYQQVEQQYRAKYKQRMERQFKIVKPDATPEEVTAVVDEDRGDQIFVQALQASTSYGESRAAYREVQSRQEDIRRIEKTLGELTQLFNDMSYLVEQQDETIDVVQSTAVDVERNVETGLTHTDKAVASARAARRKRWICFIIVLVILAIVGIVVGITVPKK